MADKDMPKWDVNAVREQTRQMSSLSTSVKKLQEGEMKRFSANKDVSRLISTTAKVVKKMGGAAEAMATGIKNTTVGAAKYTKEAIKQYSQALNQDIQLDVGRLRTMTMAGGPVIGYFINQLIKTPTFRNAIGAIKDKIAETMSAAGAKFKSLVASGAASIKDSLGSVFSKVGGVFSKLFRRKPKELSRGITKKSETKRHGIFVEKDGEIMYYPTSKKSKPTEIPQMAKGGVTGEGGLARLHPAEVVMPVEKLMLYQEKARIDQQEAFNLSFRKALNYGYREYDKPFYRRFIDGLFDLKSAIIKDPINLTYRLRTMWLNLLEKHPVFRNITKFGTAIFKTFTLPFKILFTRFGGKYKRMVSRHMNPMVSTAQTIGAFYPIMTWKQDQMIQLSTQILEATRDTASALTGKKYGRISLVKFGRTSLARILGGYIKRLGMWEIKKGIGLVKSITRKTFGIKEKTRGSEITRSSMELLLDIQAKALYRLDMITRALIPKELYEKLMEKESNQIRKMVKLTDAELGIEKKRLSTQEKMKRGIILLGDKLESSKGIFRKMRDVGVKTYNRTVNAVKIERKQSDTLDRVAIGIGKARTQAYKTGRKQIEKVSEQIKHAKEQKSLSKRLAEKIDRLRTGTKNVFKSVFGKIFGVIMGGIGILKGMFGKVFGKGGSLLMGLGGVIIKGFSKIPFIGKLAPLLTKLGGVVSKLLPFAGKLASFGARYVAPIAAAVGTIYGAIKAQGRYGDPIGEKLSTWERVGLGATETLDTATFGIFGLKKKMKADVEQAKSHRKNIAISEMKLFKAYQNRLKKGLITQSAFNKIAGGGVEGINDRLIQLRKNKEVVQIGDMIMTNFEKYGWTGAKASFKENVISPIISTSEVASMKARGKASEMKTGLESSEKVQKGMEDMKKFQGVVINNFNRATSAINNNISSAVNGMNDKRSDLSLDSGVLDIIRGDLE